MTVYFYDWRSVDAINRFFHNVGATEVTGTANEFANGDIVFVHARCPDDWIEKAKQHPQVDFVFMSTEPRPTAPATHPNTHDCLFPADRLQGIPRIKSFFATLNEGGDRSELWKLLTPEPYPEELVAVYLVDVAKAQGVLLTEDVLAKEVKEKARSQFMERDGTGWFDDNQRPGEIKRILGTLD